MEGGVLKVVRGAFLAMKGTRQRNLYFLDGYTVTGRAAVSSSSDDEASDTSRLWHMRLGHVGEKALQGLVKQGLLKGAKTEALMYASHIVNRLPASALDGKTPKEVEFEFPKKSEKASPTVDGPDDQDEISIEVEDSAPLSEIRQQPESIATSRLKRDIRKPARYTDMVAYALPIELDDTDTLKYRPRPSSSSNMWTSIFGIFSYIQICMNALDRLPSPPVNLEFSFTFTE
ncbi:hypothetical protein LWI28_006437 [Acer negundo]|uniref:GAG-pre-integrase domain-containing protein n=1 Tax=Acer negundo TaxID=4023 RepID=A0AAD5JST5_ACENE|nr:hypothetical protein LWI28_006437 [Acer negundo]